MIYLVVVLIISHFVVLYYINSFIKAYKLNNHNYLTSELKKLEALFLEGLVNIDSGVNLLTEKSVQSFEKLKLENTNFIRAHKSSFNDVTSFIQNDYRSLTQSLEKNNDLLVTLLQKTEENITKNIEMKPLLINSNDELEKIYSKIKMLITNYEKSINDIQDEMESSLNVIESTLEGKIKQLATSGEKTIRDSIENSKTTITKITEETNNGLKKVLKENQIKVLTEKVETIDSEFKSSIEEVMLSINGLDEMFFNKLKEYKDKEGNKKGFFGF